MLSSVSAIMISASVNASRRCRREAPRARTCRGSSPRSKFPNARWHGQKAAMTVVLRLAVMPAGGVTTTVIIR